MAYNDIFMVLVFSIGKKMTIMFYGWFLFRTNNLANELLVTLLGLLLLQLSNSTDPENIN